MCPPLPLKWWAVSKVLALKRNTRFTPSELLYNISCCCGEVLLFKNGGFIFLLEFLNMCGYIHTWGIRIHTFATSLQAGHRSHIRKNLWSPAQLCAEDVPTKLYCSLLLLKTNIPPAGIFLAVLSQRRRCRFRQLSLAGAA